MQPASWNESANLTPGSTPDTQLGAAPGEGVEAFRERLRGGELPPPQSLDAAEFFAQHRFPLDPPACEQDLCLQAGIGIHPTLFTGQGSSVVVVGLNSAVDPATHTQAKRHIVLAVDMSAGMQAHSVQDLQETLRAIRQKLTKDDRISVIAMGTQAVQLFATQPPNKLDLDEALTGINAVGALNLYDGLHQAYSLLEHSKREGERTLLLAAVASDPTQGITDPARLAKLTQSYAKLGHSLHLVALGPGVDAVALREIVQASEGHFYFLDTTDTLPELLSSPRTLRTVSLARNIDVRLELSPAYRLRGLYGAKQVSKGDSHVTVRMPSFDLVSSQSEGDDPPSPQLVFALEFARTQAPVTERVAELSYQYQQDVDTIVEGRKLLLAAPAGSETLPAGYFESEAARRGFGLVSLYAGFSRALDLVANQKHGRALTMLRALEAGLQGWPDSAVNQEREYLQLMQNLLENQSVDAPSNDPVIDPIVEQKPPDPGL